MTEQQQKQREDERRQEADKIVRSAFRLYNAGIITAHELDQLANRIETKIKVII